MRTTHLFGGWGFWLVVLVAGIPLTFCYQGFANGWDAARHDFARSVLPGPACTVLLFLIVLLINRWNESARLDRERQAKS